MSSKIHLLILTLHTLIYTILFGQVHIALFLETLVLNIIIYFSFRLRVEVPWIS